MKARESIATSAALAAMAVAWLYRQRQTGARRTEECFEQRCAQEAVDTFEGEGGLVLS
jgi:hypothetical protein